MSRFSALIGLLSIAAITFAGCGVKRQPQPAVSETRLLLDTVCTVTVYEPRDRALVTGALDLCAEYEQTFSVAIEGSDIWRINHARGEAVTISAQTAEMISIGLDFGRLSDGMFDITIGRLSSLWNFKGDPAVPDAGDIRAAIGTVDYRVVVLSGETVQLRDPEATLDTGGVAKGYIADKLADYLKERGVKSALIDLGGNVVTVGEKADGNMWRVGVRKPFGENGELLGVIETGEASVVTSGIYERQFESGGRVYHHILDPKTGMPAVSDVVSATVLTENSAAGDALSTILVLAGSERAAELTGETPGFIGAVLALSSGEVILLGEVNFRSA